MSFYNQSEDYQPLTYIGRFPIYVSTALIIIYVASMVACSLAKAVGAEWPIWLPYSSFDVVHGFQLWRLISYSLFQFASVPFAIQMLMLYWFGPDVEKFIGRTNFIRLYLVMVLSVSLMLTLLAFFGPQEYAGSNDLLFGIFIAFATIYPNVEIFFLRITMKWVAWILFLIYTLMALMSHSAAWLSALWLCSAIGHFGMRMMGVGGGLDWWDSWMEARRNAKLARKRNFKVVKEAKTTESIDSILDKISREGIGSLTASEKAALEQARSALMKRDRSG